MDYNHYIIQAENFIKKIGSFDESDGHDASCMGTALAEVLKQEKIMQHNNDIIIDKEKINDIIIDKEKINDIIIDKEKINDIIIDKEKINELIICLDNK